MINIYISCVCVCVYTVYEELGILISMCSRQMRNHCLIPSRGNFMWADHLIPGLIFFPENIICSKVATEWDTVNSVQVYVQNRRSVSAHIHPVEAFQ